MPTPTLVVHGEYYHVKPECYPSISVVRIATTSHHIDGAVRVRLVIPRAQDYVWPYMSVLISALDGPIAPEVVRLLYGEVDP